jgi:hypothetical protein
MARPLFALLLTSFFLLAGCATSGSERAASSRGAITAAEIEAHSVASAHDAVLNLRPQWLRSRGETSILVAGAGLPVVFVDHARYGPPSSLQQIRARAIEAIVFLSPREATTYHGTGYPAGIIQVTTKR